jgi:hypothetical protein
VFWFWTAIGTIAFRHSDGNQPATLTNTTNNVNQQRGPIKHIKVIIHANEMRENTITLRSIRLDKAIQVISSSVNGLSARKFYPKHFNVDLFLKETEKTSCQSYDELAFLVE